MFQIVLAAGVAAASAVTPAPTETAIEYRSAFEGYRPWQAQEPREWRQVNDEVERLGGHAGQLRAAPPPGTRPASPANPGGAPAPKETKK